MKDHKKVLLVSNGFYPEISPRSYRATELAREFYRQGHNVTVITKFREYNYTDFLKECPITLKMWSNSNCPTFKDFKQKIISLIARSIARFFSLFFEYPAISDMFRIKKILHNESGYDLLISFAVPYPVHWGVAWSRSSQHQIADIWVADCGDPYMGDVLDSFRKPFYFKYLEKWFCRKSDFISIPIEGAKVGYYSEFHFKIRIIPQGFYFDVMKIKEAFQSINSVPKFAYAGSFIPGVRDPEPLLQYLVNLTIPFKFFVFTNNPHMLQKYKLLLKEKLIVSEYIPRNELMEVLANMDFLINFDNNTETNSPSKLIDYAIANRPTLNIKKHFKGEDILSFLKGNYSNRMLLPDPKQHHISSIAKLFLDLPN